MEQESEGDGEDGLQKFRQKLLKYEMHELRMTFEYFRDELVYVVQIIDTLNFLTELKSRMKLDAESYESVKRDLGVLAFSQKLVHDVFDSGREAVIGFLECLYCLQTNHPHHNLLAVLSEIQHVEIGALKDQILLDKGGYSLDPDIKEIQNQHKQHLLETTQMLVECTPPGTTLERKRFPISERYVNLVVVSTHRFRRRTQHELIEIGEKHEGFLWKSQRGLERVSPKRLFCWCYQIKQVPKVVMISGVPGVGKTTLMQKCVCDWANGKLYQRFSFVFFFKFRDLNRLGKNISLEQMVLHQYPYLNTQLENILSVPEQLLFIFDGLDESSHDIDFASHPSGTSTKQIQEFGTILVKLLRQTLLKGCSVIITSRPAKLASIDNDIFQLLCEVMGFFHEERKMYFKQFFTEETLALQAFNHVKDNEALYTFCYIPSYCWIICTVLSMCFKSQQTNTNKLELFLPKTVTQLFVIFISNILTNHTQETSKTPTEDTQETSNIQNNYNQDTSNILTNPCQKTDLENTNNLLLALGWLAEYGVMNHVIVFEERDLTSFIKDRSFHLFTSFMVESKQPQYVNYSFLHLTVQEFMAALVHHIDYDPNKLQKALDKAKSFQDGRTEIFLRFLFGLSDGSTRALLKRSSLNFPSQASKKLISWLRHLSPLVKKTSKNALERRETLNIFNYLFESRNKALVSETLGQNLTIDFSKFSLTPLDCSVLAFILESCRESECLDVGKCYLGTECWNRLSPGLHTVHTLRLNLNELNDEELEFITKPLAHTDCKIQNLGLANNELTNASCSLLASAIRNNQSLTSLDLTFNNLAGPRFRDLASALSSPTCRVKHLELCALGLTHEDSQFLVTLSENTSLEYLNVSHNIITDAGSGHIKDLLQTSTSLKNICMAANGFSEEVVKQLKDLEKTRQDLVIIVW